MVWCDPVDPVRFAVTRACVSVNVRET